MKRSSYILEALGWALIIFTIAWIVLSSFRLKPLADHSSNTALEIAFMFFSTLGYLLEGLIFGTVAIVLARLVRSPEAPALGETIRNTLRNARTAGTKNND